MIKTICESCNGTGRLTFYPWNGSKPTTSVICYICKGSGKKDID